MQKLEAKTISWVGFLTAFLLVWGVTAVHGIGFTHDSGIYVISVKTLWSKGALIDHTGAALNLYPPLYILLLSLHHFIFLDVYTWAVVLHALAYAFIFYLTFRLGQLLSIRSWHLYILCIWTLFAVPLFVNAAFIWSEVVFIALVLWALYLTVCYIRKPSYGWMSALSLVSVLVVMQRYAGISFILAVAAYLFFYWKKESLAKAVKEACWYAFPAVLFLLVWAYRNQVLAGGTNIHHDWFMVGPLYNMKEAGLAIASFLLPDELPAVVLLLFLGVLLIFIIYTYRGLQASIERQIMALLMVFSLIYFLFFVTMNSLIYVSPLDERYMSPLYVPVVLLLVKSSDEWLSKQKSKRYRLLFVGVGLLLSLYTVTRFGKWFYHFYETGGGYATAYWQEEPVVKWLQQQPAPDLLMSNNPMPLILWTKDVVFAPIHPLAFYGQRNSIWYVKWNPQNTLHYLSFTPELENGKYRLDSLAVFPSAIIYKVSPK